jgi:hypothetical protein
MFQIFMFKVPKLSETKLKGGVLTSPVIRKLITELIFSETMGEKEKIA